jgi:hypothetical protein
MEARVSLIRGRLAFGTAVVLCAGVLARPRSAAADEPTKEQCVAANESAQVARKHGKLRDARAQLVLCVAQACPAPVRADCAEQLNAVDKAEPEVLIEAKDPSGAPVENVRVTLDGTLLPGPVGAAPVVLDPGPHRAAFEAEGFLRIEKTFLVREGDKDQRVSVVLEPKARVVAAIPVPAPAVATTEAASEAPSTSPSPKRVAAYAALGVGAAGIAVGSIFGVLALGNKGTLNSECNNNACKPGAQPDIDAMHSHAVIANVGWGVGLLGAGTGAVLWFLSRDEGASAPGAARAPHVAPWVGAGTAGISGSFR